MTIVGAGMAGLIAANYFRKRMPCVIERQSSLPHNHRALLRFRTDAISTITGIPFRRVFVWKEIHSEGVRQHTPSVRMMNTYSYKVTGNIQNRSVWNLNDEHRYIAPFDFVTQLASGVNLSYDTNFTRDMIQEKKGPVISTIPMPDLMRLVRWNDIPEFSYRPIWSLNTRITSPPVEVFQTIYYPDPDTPMYRASLTGSELIIEFTQEPSDPEYSLSNVCRQFGLPESELRFESPPICTLQEYGKIVPIPEEVRQEFIYSMSRDYEIYSLGRYATWKQILLDDLHRDLKVIEKIIRSETKRQRYQSSLVSVRA